MSDRAKSAAVEYDYSIRNFPKTNRNITFDPSIRMLIDLTKSKDRITFFNRYAQSGRSVYVIGATNNTDSDFNDGTNDAYITLRLDGKPVLLGQWTDQDGRRFRDISFVVSGIDRADALRLKSMYDQLEVLEVERDGVRSI